ncbi:MAG: heparinase II/III-family protein, partial [Candidatus Hydrogenedentes bacterium]|nr:heparinase II/III-family protein [Candidatus Hydrogenedentota bacterium]
VPDDFRDGIERMYNYLAYSMRPSGYGALNNDSNLDFTRPEVLAHVEQFGRRDWAYVATNGSEGDPPDAPPSRVFPWAGQVIMRSGWDADAHWAFFDVGPLGIGHWHYDKLHLSLSAHGRDILVDAGRYTYAGGTWRSYFVGSQSHNVILVDGKGQRAYERTAEEPMTGNYRIAPGFDYARGTYDAGFDGVDGDVSHTRAVAYIRGKYWVAVDRVATDRARGIEALWHYHPACTVAVEGDDVASTDTGAGNVRIVPVPGGVDWDVRLVTGQTEPAIQGWWSREYNVKEPSCCAVYTARIESTATFAWILVPGNGPVPGFAEPPALSVDGGTATIRLALPGQPPDTVTVPLDDGVAAYAPGP